jgi:hypothetical protein
MMGYNINLEDKNKASHQQFFFSQKVIKLLI